MSNENRQTPRVPDFARALITAFWPGPLTLILKAHDSLSRKVNDRLSTGKAIKRGTAITDALRFTIVFPPDGWGPNVQGVLWNIQGKGYAILDEENSWGNGDC